MEAHEGPEPSTDQEALEDHDSDLWTRAEEEEMASLIKNGNWILVDGVKYQKPIGCEWVYKRKAGIASVRIRGSRQDWWLKGTTERRN